MRGFPLQGSLYKGFPFTMDFAEKGIPLYHGFALVRDFPLQGFPFARDFPLQGISLYKGFSCYKEFPCIRDCPL